MCHDRANSTAIFFRKMSNRCSDPAATKGRNSNVPSPLGETTRSWIVYRFFGKTGAARRDEFSLGFVGSWVTLEDTLRATLDRGEPVDKSIPRTFRLSILRAYEVEYDFTTEESGSELFQS